MIDEFTSPPSLRQAQGPWRIQPSAGGRDDGGFVDDPSIQFLSRLSSRKKSLGVTRVLSFFIIWIITGLICCNCFDFFGYSFVGFFGEVIGGWVCEEIFKLCCSINFILISFVFEDFYIFYFFEE